MSKEYHFLEQLKKPTYVWFEDHRSNDETMHKHSLGQFVYVAKGFQYLHTEHTTYLLPQHFAAWIPADILHKTESQAENLQLRSIFSSLELKNSFFNEVRIFSAPNVLQEMVLYAEKWNQQETESLSETTFLRALFEELPNMCKDNVELQLPTSNHPKIRAIIQYVEQHLGETTNIVDIGLNFHHSERSLQRLFKTETGISLAKYVQYIRIMKSVELLQGGHLNISEIAYRVGYKSLQAFSNSFYDILRQRPTTFLNK